MPTPPTRAHATETTRNIGPVFISTHAWPCAAFRLSIPLGTLVPVIVHARACNCKYDYIFTYVHVQVLAIACMNVLCRLTELAWHRRHPSHAHTRVIKGIPHMHILDGLECDKIFGAAILRSDAT